MTLYCSNSLHTATQMVSKHVVHVVQEKEVKRNAKIGLNGWRKVSGVICDRRLPARVKRKVYSSVVRPVMVYGLESVVVTKKQVEEREVPEMKILRFAIGVTR